MESIFKCPDYPVVSQSKSQSGILHCIWLWSLLSSGRIPHCFSFSFHDINFVRSQGKSPQAGVSGCLLGTGFTLRICGKSHHIGVLASAPHQEAWVSTDFEGRELVSLLALCVTLFGQQCGHLDFFFAKYFWRTRQKKKKLWYLSLLRCAWDDVLILPLCTQ